VTQELRHHPSGPLVLAVTLAAVAGFVDAYVYLHVTHVFVANMSGNLVHLGMSAGLAQLAGVVSSAVALLSFVCGIIAATIYHDRQLRRDQSVRPDVLLAAEATLLLVLPAVLIGFDAEFSLHPSSASYLVLLLGSFAMGIQTAALRRVGEIAVATTYGTGSLVRIGEKLVLGARGASRASDQQRRVTVWVLLIVLLGYVTGAATSAALGASPLLLLIPSAVLIATASVTAFTPRRRGLRLRTQEPSD
jgi:uncharacterized membrane protein YoaK (UPF0700 family)